MGIQRLTWFMMVNLLIIMVIIIIIVDNGDTILIIGISGGCNYGNIILAAMMGDIWNIMGR